MSVRVIARVRPLLKAEVEKDVILQASASTEPTTTITLPDPKHAAQKFSFDFSRVFDREASQQDLFDNEISPTVKHLFAGFDVTIFAYGVTGTGKTHTMRGGKSLAERGVIPRLLSSIYRKQRKTDKDSEGEKTVEVSLSYYEIYNDKVFDLLEPPEKRTLAGLPIRDNHGKTVISGLTERPCTTLKEFELLYDEANVNRSTSATKLNAHSSRSHAILQVKITQTSGEKTTISTISAIDLAGSEDNRRTDNNKERLVESSSINKSLFVLAQCVEAISKKQARIPYRESKMTRILSLGQNNGLTIMILNLAPVRSYHLDTLSSLNFANRTKKIEVREVENEPIFAGKLAGKAAPSTLAGTGLHRQPLRPIPSTVNANLKSFATAHDKPTKSFTVFAESAGRSRSSDPRSLKRGSDTMEHLSARPSKIIKSSSSTTLKPRAPEMSRANIEDLVNRLVDEKLAKQALSENDQSNAPALSDEIQRRLDALEERVEKKEDGGRAEGLQYLLMAKQHTVRGEEASALRMYQLAVPFFPNNDKLANKMSALQDKIRRKREGSEADAAKAVPQEAAVSSRMALTAIPLTSNTTRKRNDDRDDDYTDESQHHNQDDYASDDSFQYKSKTKVRRPKKAPMKVLQEASNTDPLCEVTGDASPRSSNLLRIINTRDLSQIRQLRGVGLKKAEAIISCLCDMDEDDEQKLITDLYQLGSLRGVGSKTVENMRSGISV